MDNQNEKVVPEQDVQPEAPRAPRRAAPRAADTTAGRSGGAGSSSRGRNLLVVWVLLSLAVGIAIGVFGMRSRYRALEVVASVNGVTITKDDLFGRLQSEFGQATMRQMINEHLQLQYAKEQGVLPTDEEVEARFRKLAEEPGFDEGLRQRGVDAGTFKRQLKLSMAQAAVIGKGVDVTDEEVQKFYKENIDKTNPQALFYTPEMVQLAVIVTQTEAQAQAALKELNAGKPWEEVVEKHSQDSSKINRGILPPTFRGRTNSSQVPGLDSTIFAMKQGDQVGPRQFAGAWWIIRCLDRKSEVLQPFDKVKEQATTGAILVKAGPERMKEAEAGFAEFRAKAETNAFWPQYAEAVKVQAQ